MRAFLKFAGRHDVAALHSVERVMAVPMKRFEQPLLGHLTRPEMIAVLGNPGIDWTSRRDHLLISLLYNTGARVSEIVGVRVVDVVLDGAACVHLHGKGRKDRSVPLWRVDCGSHTRLVAGQPHPARIGRIAAQSIRPPDDAVQRCAATGDSGGSGVSRAAESEDQTRFAAQSAPYDRHAPTAKRCPVQCHRPVARPREQRLRRTATSKPNLEMKEKALARLEAPDIKLKRYRASDDLMRFLRTPCNYAKRLDLACG